MPTATPITPTDDELDDVRYDHDGLVPAICQEASTRQVLMMAWMNADTLRQTLADRPHDLLVAQPAGGVGEGRDQRRAPVGA